MFEQFARDECQVNEQSIHYAKGGSGPAVLLLHGYPQTHVIWHKIADHLADKFTVVASDLRGYGDSSKPVTDSNHETYSKRNSARDQVALMEKLGYPKFMVVGHDRGGRVAHRMALDFSEKIIKVALLDIAPTYAMYKTTDMEFAQAYYHWFFLIQPSDLPERMIGADPDYYLRKKFAQWGKDSSALTQEAWDEYRRCFTEETIHASCEDYRASVSIDLLHDQESLDAGDKIQCPILCLWGNKGFVGRKYDVVKEWSVWGQDVRGYGLPCGHYLPEEAPEETLAALLEFLA